MKGILNFNPGSVISCLGSPNCKTNACWTWLTIKKVPDKVKNTAKPININIKFLDNFCLMGGQVE